METILNNHELTQEILRNEDSIIECPICYIETDCIYKTRCSHAFCYSCAERISRNKESYSCPMCRHECNETDDILMSTTVDELYQRYLDILDTEDSTSLIVSKDLKNIIGFILTSKYDGLLKYLLSDSCDDTEFKCLYKSVMIEKRRYFPLIKDPVEAFALALLMYKYH